MKKITQTILLFLLTTTLSFATENEKNALQVQTEGYMVTVMDFKDGDAIKLFEAETGIHILSKTRGFIDLSQLPNGNYILESTNGKSTTIERTEIELFVSTPLGTAYVVSEDAPEELPEDDLAEELRLLESKKAIDIKQEGNIVTVVDFKEGDAIKLFEVKDTVHVLTKSSGVIDLTFLEVGKYFIENQNGAVAFIEKFASEEDQKNLEASYLYASN